jgi:hypothetical protein
MSRHRPSSWDLTDEQWYAVCLHFPKVAARAYRPMIDVSRYKPDTPVKRGPLFAFVSAAVAELEESAP